MYVLRRIHTDNLQHHHLYKGRGVVASDNESAGTGNGSAENDYDATGDRPRHRVRPRISINGVRNNANDDHERGFRGDDKAMRRLPLLPLPCDDLGM